MAQLLGTPTRPEPLYARALLSGAGRGLTHRACRSLTGQGLDSHLCAVGHQRVALPCRLVGRLPWLAAALPHSRLPDRATHPGVVQHLGGGVKVLGCGVGA